MNKLYSNYIIFNDFATANNYKQTLLNAGFNLNYPIYKMEFFCNESSAKKREESSSSKKLNRDKEVKVLEILQQIYKFLTCITRLNKKGVQVNYLIFVTEDIYKNAEKVVKHFNVNNVLVYCKNEVNYKLLGAINYYNINTTKNNTSLNTMAENKRTGFSINYKNFNLYLQNFSYNNYYLNTFKTIENTLNLTLSCTQNCNENLLIFKLKITNLLKTNLLLNFNFCACFAPQSLKNAVFLQNTSKWYLYQENLYLQNSPTFLVGKFSEMNINKFKINVKKTFKIPPLKTEIFYFAFSNINNNLVQNSLENSQNNLLNDITKNNTNSLFENKQAVKKYANSVLNSLQFLYENNGFNKIKLPKVLTENKTLNTLLNNFLPQKIIKNYIVYNFKNLFSKISLKDYLQDFYNLKNKNFNLSLVNKSFIPNNLSSLFIQNKNLYQIYLNLFYFKLGIFPSNNKVNINSSTEMLENRAVVSLQQTNTNINILNNNLKNEIKVNSILYTNLPFLTLNAKTQNLHLQF